MDLKDETILLDEMKQGNEQAFRYLFTYYPRLLNYASRFIEDRKVVADLIQDSFLKLWEKRDMLEAVSLASKSLRISVRNSE